MRVPAVLAASLLVSACAPQGATIVAGDYTAYLAASNSITYQRGALKLEEFDRSFYVDCREFVDAKDDDENEDLRLGDGPGDGRENRLPICPGDGPTGSQWPPQQEVWLDDDGFLVVGSALDPWRAEAIITSEGDVQLGFHQRLPGGEDFRFAFVVDPNFQPKECVQKEDGTGVEHRPLDGDWVTEWSKDLSEDEGGGKLFYLNSSAYQFDPEATYLHNGEPATKNLDRWFLPNEWLGGHAEAKFADDRGVLRTTRFGEPAAYLGFEAQESSVGSLDLTPDVYTAQLYYCQPYIEKYDACLEEDRVDSFDLCMDKPDLMREENRLAEEAGEDAPHDVGDIRELEGGCLILFRRCIEEEIAEFSGVTYDVRPNAYEFDPSTSFGGCAVEYAPCARDAMNGSGDADACAATYRTCVVSSHEDCLADTEERARAALQTSRAELRRAGVSEDAEEETAGALPKYGPRLHTNLWRAPDGLPAGVDGWMELNYNWVHFDEGSVLEPGGSATGEFMLTFDASDSATRMFVRGEFEVKRFRKDSWTTAYLPAIKFEQNGTTECGDAPE
jgi:hypothetical protein